MDDVEFWTEIYIMHIKGGHHHTDAAAAADKALVARRKTLGKQ